MRNELAIALIGAGSALTGAVIAGTAAVVAASKTARSAYLGSLDSLRRTAQREVYAELLRAAHAYEAGTGAVLESAGFLLEGLLSEQEGLPRRHSSSERSAFRRAISSAADPEPVAAAARQVELEGPSRVAAAARNVRAAAQQLSTTLNSIEDADEGFRPATSADLPREHFELLKSAISMFTETARKHLNHR
ncbi:hypothetical protein ABZ905_14065 [Streptomyces parvus]|uniref:hypothetical protein n=1 Tax=Streptomyces TaxID=1883 RepID=UPI000B68EC8A|nr:MULTISPECIES: hypothetical protein [unclassified Streptomyces]MYX01023.1 hypothetical protein [Streptomyces sp. SID8378]SNB75636.1 hypothetical protein SAMN02745831_00975 [Streptomyces sp. PgraA7]